MTEYADEHFDPTWKDGGYYYPSSPDYAYTFNRDWLGYIGNVGPVTGNVLVGFARINPKDGLWEIYNRPWEKAHFEEPYITDVEYLEANVTQAVYDPKKDALIVTLTPGPVASESTSFTVRQLDPMKTYSLIKDGKVLGEVNQGLGTAPAGVEWQPDGSLRVGTDLNQAHSFVLKSVSSTLASR